MKSILKYLNRTSLAIIHSIAFYPVLITFVFFLCALGMLSLENIEFVTSLKENIPYLFIQDYETARSILSTLIGGILSLTVFSFTMVMVVLSQASSNFSPRILPNLIANKRHQIILGIYIGTLTYCILILISLGAYGVDTNSLGLSTMAAALFGVICIGLFVYFIHSISTAIQIHTIVDRLFEDTWEYLEKEHESQVNSKVELKLINTDNWTTVKNNKTGYFRGFYVSLMKNSLIAQNNQIEILPYINEHMWEGQPILKIKNPLTQEEIDNLIFCIEISSNRHQGDQGMSGLIKLMEIAVKAMSPGINDPGTAIEVIVRLGQLLRKILHFSPTISQYINDSETILIRHHIAAQELFRIVVQPIRLYAKKDSTVLYELISALKFIQQDPDVSKEDKKDVTLELEALAVDVQNYIENDTDKRRILAHINQNF